MLTNEVQIAYAETEGYVPVTSKAQESAEYQDYLSRSGEDKNKHYSIKIDASRLLMDNVDKTFTTPVFNGSASVRDAAGQLIETTAKSVRRHQTANDEFFTKLYADTGSLYRLDQINVLGTTTSERAQLGPLPSTAVWLLVCLGAAWVLLGVWYAASTQKAKKAKQRKQ